ncbi:MAG: hypothetical protein RL141_707 [Candidatus Parcubacteria bacterium]|jgi:hypothetical protein
MARITEEGEDGKHPPLQAGVALIHGRFPIHPARLPSREFG